MTNDTKTKNDYEDLQEYCIEMWTSLHSFSSVMISCSLNLASFQ